MIEETGYFEETTEDENHVVSADSCVGCRCECKCVCSCLDGACYSDSKDANPVGDVTDDNPEGDSSDTLTA